jgi:hypothetical protein
VCGGATGKQPLINRSSDAGCEVRGLALHSPKKTTTHERRLAIEVDGELSGGLKNSHTSERKAESRKRKWGGAPFNHSMLLTAIWSLVF